MKFTTKSLLQLFLFLSIATSGYYIYNNQEQFSFSSSNFSNDLQIMEAGIPMEKFGFNINHFKFNEKTIEKNEMLSTILGAYNVSYQAIHEVAHKAKDVYDVRNLREGKKCMVVTDSCDYACALIYTPNPYRYVKYNLQDSIFVDVVEHPIQKKIETGTGVLESSLWQSMIDADLSPALITRMEDALAWSIDFHHAQKGDQYKLIYEKEYIDGEEVGIGKLLGAYYKNYDNEYYAVWYDNEAYSGFYDLEGRPTKKTFLKSPVKFSRISSTYSLNRFHPVLKRNKPHYGTDYAAPYGTPIMAVANGVITKASFTRGNGNYVKIKHDNKYQTQYLHMTKFASGIRSGVHVKQGQTIGYVGSTGLATGPHVCFRFWKNGRQVDHRKENFPPAEPMPKEQLPEFFEHRDSMIQQLISIPIKELAITENNNGTT